MSAGASVIGGAWAIRLLRTIVAAGGVIPAGEICLAEIFGKRVRITSDWLPRGWADIEAVCGRDYEVARRDGLSGPSRP